MAQPSPFTEQGMQESQTEKGGDEAAAKDEGHGRYDNDKRIKGQDVRKQQLTGQ